MGCAGSRDPKHFRCRGRNLKPDGLCDYARRFYYLRRHSSSRGDMDCAGSRGPKHVRCCGRSLKPEGLRDRARRFYYLRRESE